MPDALHHAYRALSDSVARTASRLTISLRLYRGRSLALVFVPLLLAILANGLLALRSLGNLVASERVVSQTHALQAQIHVVETALVDAESAQRGYVLTGDTIYLAPYVALRSTLGDEVARLRTQTSGHVTQQRRAALIAAQIAPLLDQLQSPIDLRAAQLTSEAIAALREDNNQQAMRTVRALLTQMDRTEEDLLDARLRTAGTSVTEAQVTMLVATSADVILLATLFALVWRTFAVRERHLSNESSARATAEAAVGLRDEFLSIASHELRTPVTILLGNTQLLTRLISGTAEQDERIRRNIGAIHRQAQRLQTLIATMLDVSRIERGQLTIVRDPLDLVTLARSVVDQMRPTSPAHPIKLTAHSDESHPILVYGDALRLEQVLLNLLQNAIKYSPDGGPIRVEVARTSDSATLSVTDSGLGIPEDVLPHLFERFYRAPAVRSEHISGMGIGLYVVHEIVAMHGGEVAVASKDGAGTTFVVRLPLAPPQPSA